MEASDGVGASGSLWDDMSPPSSAPGPKRPPPPLREANQDTQVSFRIPGSLASPSFVQRSRAYSFVLDEHGNPIELGSGRFAKAFLGEERWNESKTVFTRN